MKNTKIKDTKGKKIKGGVTGKGFDVLGQPSSEAKRRGWERKREARQLLDLIKNMGDMSYKEARDMQEDISRHPEKYTLKQVKIAQYLSDKRFTIDYLDRHLGKAVQQVEAKVESITVNDLVSKLESPETPYAEREEDKSNTEIPDTD